MVAPVLSIAATSANKAEGSGGGMTAFTFAVTRTGDTSASSSVFWTWEASDSPSTSADDFSGTNGTLTFGVGVTSQTITLNVNADNVVEPNENFKVFISVTSNGTADPAHTEALGVIQNDDFAASDLVVSSLQLSPTTIQAGSTTTATYTVKNQTSTSPVSGTGFYLSTNATLDASDTLLQTRSAPSLPAGQTSNDSFSLLVPASTAAGNYFIIADADYNNAVSETNESNNASNAVAITVGAAPTPVVNSPPPPGTTADMIMRRISDGTFEIYDLGLNSILAGWQLGQVGSEWVVQGFGGFFSTDTTDMILRNRNTGGFEIYDIVSNNITSAAFLGQVGFEYSLSGFGHFSSRTNETDMIMRSTSGAFEIYDIANNSIISAAPMGQVGLEFQVVGFGQFSTRAGESDMLMRNFTTGAFEVYDIANNSLISAAFLGQVGLEWQVAGFGNFSGRANETDMILRDVNTGGFEIYDIISNSIVSAAFLGQVGLEWQVAFFGQVSGTGASDMVLRNVNTGAFEYYDIRNNQLANAGGLGQVGLEFDISGSSFIGSSSPGAPSPGASSPGASSPIASSPLGAADSATSQLVQAMAGFPSGGAALDQGSPRLAAQDATSPPDLAASALQHAA